MQDPTTHEPCAPLINAQRPLNRRTHQVPEPWSGHIESAPILFFGSNPSINPIEVFPAVSWSDDDVVDFFANRFGGGKRAWTWQGRVLRSDGTHGDRAGWVRFWAGYRGRATELLGRRAVDGVDFAVAEAVHCKSKGEQVEAKAVAKRAARTCADRYLRALLDLSAAAAVVSFGGIADAELRRVVGLPAGRYAYADARHFIFVDHPAGRGAMKKMSSVLLREQIAAVRHDIATAAAFRRQ